MKFVYSFDDTCIPLSVKLIFWSFYMLVFVYAICKTVIFAPKNDKQYVNASGLIVLYFAIYALFYCVNPDYFSYREWMLIPNYVDWNKERFYYNIIFFCRSLLIDYPYELFRLIVWGGALLLVLSIAKRNRRHLNPELVILLMFIFYSDTFCYARATLGMSVFFFGITVYLSTKNNWVKILGIALAICSYYFHREMIIGIAIIPGIILPMEKRRMLPTALVLLGIMIVGFYLINSHLGFVDKFLDADDLTEKMTTYNDRPQGVFRVSTLIKYFCFYLPFFYTTKIFYRCNKLPKSIAGLYRITFFIIMASITFLVIEGARSTYTYRVLYISFIPLSILTTYCYNQGLLKKRQMIILLLIALAANSTRLYNSM